MAAAMAERVSNPSAEPLTEYAENHLNRALVPVFALAAVVGGDR